MPFENSSLVTPSLIYLKLSLDGLTPLSNSAVTYFHLYLLTSTGTNLVRPLRHRCRLLSRTLQPWKHADKPCLLVFLRSLRKRTHTEW